MPVKVDKSISKNIAINYKSGNGFSLDTVMITPFNTLISVTMPEQDRCNIRVFDENNNEIGCNSGNILDGNRQIDYFNVLPKESKSLRVV